MEKVSESSGHRIIGEISLMGVFSIGLSAPICVTP